ncbi:branched-chain alpha-keto acid lipoamide acyltransferase [Magnaporthiopsis poae ATCC 64411]|uniref:Dihydrolipoamide acetyltransferase component of pyruvate dehydrogenase complex n=1 Tax=Magnaporthiopsis poae (strain ATCC 64411 / 73-15) TaxID=644358 RepID=A0A0C4DTH6_MAGP6|nr:branched-chain alpha-keto acid lipoamide acyltransferase [Magnaporthiopsis poae ATCC 64411]
MLLQRSCLLLLRHLPRPSSTRAASSAVGAVYARRRQPLGASIQRRKFPSAGFHTTSRLCVVKPVLLADIGEGIVECEIIQWFVEPGARIEEFSPLCEVQSDKASVEITSRFTGVVKKLYYDAGEMAKVGKPFVDIDIQGEARPEDLDALTPAEVSQDAPKAAAVTPEAGAPTVVAPDMIGTLPAVSAGTPAKSKGKCAGLATPAVRHLCKELNVDLSSVDGTGRDGRVLKEDIYKFVQSRDGGVAPGKPSATASGVVPAAQQPPHQMPGSAPTAGAQSETVVQMSPTQHMMFKTMTRSLSIPHFLYADEIDLTSLVELRTRLNKVLASGSIPGQAGPAGGAVAEVSKLSYLPFVIKAVSLALYEYPILNARVDAAGPGDKPVLVFRKQHNIGVAMDTPQGAPGSRGQERQRAKRAVHRGRAEPAAGARAGRPPLAPGYERRHHHRVQHRQHRRHVPQPRRGRARSGHPRHRSRAHRAGL